MRARLRCAARWSTSSERGADYTRGCDAITDPVGRKMLAARCCAALRRAQPVASPASICLRRAAWLQQHRGLCAAAGSIFDAKIPEMGDSISEGTILSLMKNPGDYVAAEETVAEIETDKVTVEAKSPHAGTIKEIFVAVDDTVEVGKPFFSLEVGVGEAPAA
eukprot:scaffold130301_cov51-Phaeocystis_antarctica.AAC.1